MMAFVKFAMVLMLSCLSDLKPIPEFPPGLTFFLSVNLIFDNGSGAQDHDAGL